MKMFLNQPKFLITADTKELDHIMKLTPRKNQNKSSMASPVKKPSSQLVRGKEKGDYKSSVSIKFLTVTSLTNYLCGFRFTINGINFVWFVVRHPICVILKIFPVLQEFATSDAVFSY